MGKITDDLIDEILAVADQAARPAVAVETGTYHGDGTAVLAKHFSKVWTIELHSEWSKEVERRFAGDRVSVIWGNSGAVMTHLAKSIVETPCFFYLDAHWFAREGVPNKRPLPLWEELRAIEARPWADIIVVDDVHAFGRDANPVLEDGAQDLYPGLWKDVSTEAIVERLTRVRFWMVFRDHLVIYREAAE